MTILLIVVLIFALLYQNSRISKIESIINKKSFSESSANSTQSTSQGPEKTTVHQSSPISQSIPVAHSSVSQNVPQTNTQISNSDEDSGKILGRIGIVAVILGVAFFLKYAFDHDWVGPAGRVVIGILAGIFAMGLGQVLRKKYSSFADLIMGGGMAILYLSIYASYGFYNLVDPMTAFLGLVFVTAVGTLMSIMDDTKSMSFIALLGGFLTPFIIGMHELGPWVTFTYVSILNIGILGILIYKKWTYLVLIGLMGTWVHFGTWYASSYTEDLLIPTITFLIIQFLIFTASSLIRIIVEKIKANELDYFVLVSTSLVFALTAYNILTPKYDHYAALGAVLTACYFLVIALIAFKENPSDRTVNIFLPGLAVSFLTVAVPIQFNGPWIASWWLIESLVLYTIASRASSRGFQVMGVVVYILGLCQVLWYLITYVKPEGYAIFFNGPFIMLVFSALTAYAIAYIYYKYGSISPEIQKRGIVFFVVVANVVTLFALTSQIVEYYRLQAMINDFADYGRLKNISNTSVSIMWAMYAALLTVIGFAKRYISVRRMGLALFIITAFKVVVDVWSLGELYRIISFIVFGLIALTVSFLYVKYHDRLKEMV